MHNDIAEKHQVQKVWFSELRHSLIFCFLGMATTAKFQSINLHRKYDYSDERERNEESQ